LKRWFLFGHIASESNDWARKFTEPKLCQRSQ
jgi:hypothetical protein